MSKAFRVSHIHQVLYTRTFALVTAFKPSDIYVCWRCTCELKWAFNFHQATPQSPQNLWTWNKTFRLGVYRDVQMEISPWQWKVVFMSFASLLNGLNCISKFIATVKKGQCAWWCIIQVVNEMALFSILLYVASWK